MRKNQTSTQLQEMYRDLIPEGARGSDREQYYRTVDRPGIFFLRGVAADGDKGVWRYDGVLCVHCAPFLVVRICDCFPVNAEGRGVGRKKYLRHYWMNLLKISVNMHFWFLPDLRARGFMKRLAIQDDIRAGFKILLDIRKL